MAHHSAGASLSLLTNRVPLRLTRHVKTASLLSMTLLARHGMCMQTFLAVQLWGLPPPVAATAMAGAPFIASLWHLKASWVRKEGRKRWIRLAAVSRRSTRCTEPVAFTKAAWCHRVLQVFQRVCRRRHGRGATRCDHHFGLMAALIIHLLPDASDAPLSPRAPGVTIHLPFFLTKGQ